MWLLQKLEPRPVTLPSKVHVSGSVTKLQNVGFELPRSHVLDVSRSWSSGRLQKPSSANLQKNCALSGARKRPRGAFSESFQKRCFQRRAKPPVGTRSQKYPVSLIGYFSAAKMGENATRAQICWATILGNFFFQFLTTSARAPVINAQML